MALNRYVVRVDPQGKPMAVDILDTSGTSVPAFESSQFAAPQLSLPLTISAPTDFWLKAPGPYDVSCKVATTEIASADGPQRVQVSDVPVLVVPPWEVLAPSSSGGSSAVLAGDPGGTIDATTYDNTVTGSGKLNVAVFPADTVAVAIAIEGDAFPRIIMLSDPDDGVFYLADGTVDAYNNGARISWDGGTLNLPATHVSALYSGGVVHIGTHLEMQSIESAATPGTVVGRLLITDNSGNPLGYLPIYDDIT